MTEQECQRVFDYIIEKEHLSRMKLRMLIKEINQGHAYYNSGLVTIPKWALRNQYEGTAYVIHELTHQVCYRNKKGDWRKTHGSYFKRTENRLLKLFGLRIDRKKAYSKAIYFYGNKVIDK